MNTLRKNPILIAVILLVASAIAAHIYFNTDLLGRVAQTSETPQARTERILNEQRKQVVDDRGYFTTLIPQSWVTQTPEPQGATLSSLIATTDDFATNQEGVITAGAHFEISARDTAPADLPTLNLLENFNTRLGDETVDLSVYRSADGSGLTLITQTSRGNTHYEILMRYNAGAYLEGEQIFLNILRSTLLTPKN